MSVCDDSWKNLIWQWNEYDFMVSSQQSPLYALEILVRTCTLDQATNRINGDTPGEEDGFMGALKLGQIDTPSSVQSYYQCRATMNFWSYVDTVCAASDNPSNFGEAKKNTDWQIGANKNSMTRAYEYFQQRSSLQPINGDAGQCDLAKLFLGIIGMTFLLDGQHHDRGAMNCYRACYRDDREQLFRLVSSYFASGIQAV